MHDNNTFNNFSNKMIKENSEAPKVFKMFISVVSNLKYKKNITYLDFYVEASKIIQIVPFSRNSRK